MKLQWFALSVCLMFLFTSCNDDDAFTGPCTEESPPPMDQSDLYDCHQNQNLDSIGLRNTLIGTWLWDYEYHGWTGRSICDENRGMSIVFAANGTVALNGDSVIGTTWSIVAGTNGAFNIGLEDRITPFWGVPLLCNDLLLFYASFADGNDNFFSKAD